MIFLDVFPEDFFCPLCGSKIGIETDKPCSHLVAFFTEKCFENNGCHFLRDDIRNQYFSKLEKGFPRTMDDWKKLQFKNKLFQEYKKANNVFVLSYKEKSARYNEEPILRFVFQETTARI